MRPPCSSRISHRSSDACARSGRGAGIHPPWSTGNAISSGGEAQRVKLSTELSRRGTGSTVYILDEPTTGLHFADVEKLLSVLHRLVDAGNTVVVIEHNLDVLKTADHIIDLGPGGGDAGGEIVAAGTPEEVAANPRSATGNYLALGCCPRAAKMTSRVTGSRVTKPRSAESASPSPHDSCGRD